MFVQGSQLTEKAAILTQARQPAQTVASLQYDLTAVRLGKSYATYLLCSFTTNQAQHDRGDLILLKDYYAVSVAI